ncbi:MAG: flavin reductase family protein [Elusimicrobiota bacterium]|jgi:flavin reductase (DIM6/NTAB) family NADH-FMN oxidoreductase RutF|nr:flavin reductase family protein [Elusimicrobiota bacterium]
MSEKYNKDIEKSFEILERGIFLTTLHNGRLNTMTISWGAAGYIWNKPVFIVLVRGSRHTHKLLENSGEFTISVPYEDMPKELGVCGTQSGRDIDKFKECNLKTFKSQKIDTPAIAVKGVHYECMNLYKTNMTFDNLDLAVKQQWYKDGDLHTIYIAEIVNTAFL